ncbi:MAG TPA: SgcJ/EcaC family oxidoreductase [Acetobacteraceae bacterium]|nr:SgcJ/EcaC family oxidoreductase [Acetobacteraceae bacterium]
MHRRWFLVLLVGSLSSLSAYAQDAKKTADDFAAKWVAAYDAGDAPGLAALFTPDGVFNAPSGAAFKGRDAIEKALAGRMKAGWTKETVTTSDAGAAGSAVWAAGDYALLGSGEVAGKQTGGRFGWVLVRDGNAWHVAMLTANVTPPK